MKKRNKAGKSKAKGQSPEKKLRATLKLFKDAKPNSWKPSRSLNLGPPPISTAVETNRRRH